MDKYIKEQLQKVRRAKIPAYNDDTKTIFINRLKQCDCVIQEDHYYIIELQNYLINPPPNFTLAANWNNGENPKSKYINCHIVKILGKMICIDGIGFDIETNNNLTDVYKNFWLPEAGIKILEEL